MSGGMRLWIGFGLSALFLALFFLTLPLGEWLDALASADYIYVVPAIGMYLVALLFRTIRWQRLLWHMRPAKVTRLFPVVVVGYMANNLLPLRLGELVRSYYVGEREGISKVSALVTIVLERLLDAITLLLFISVIALFVPLLVLAEGFGEWSSVAWPLLVAGVSLPFVVAFGALMLMAYAPQKARALATALMRPLPARLATRLNQMLDTFLDGLASLRSPRTILVLFLLSIPIWLFESGLFFLIGYAFGLHEVYDNLFEMAIAMVLVTSIANIGASIPAAPGGIGVFELIARETLVLLPLAAVDRAVAGGYIAVVHAALLLPPIVLGQIFLWGQNISLGSLSRAGRQGPKECVGELAPAPMSAEGDESQ